MYPAVFVIHFISAAVTLLASLALMVQFSLPYNTAGRASVLYSFILIFYGLNIFLIMPVISNTYQYVINVHSFFISYHSS